MSHWAGDTQLEFRCQIEVSFDELLFPIDQVHTHVKSGDVDQVGLWAERHRGPVFATNQIRANALGSFVELRPIFRVLNRSTGLQIDFAGPVHCHKGFGRDEVAVGPVQDIEKAIAVGLK